MGVDADSAVGLLLGLLLFINLLRVGAQSFTSLKADLRQDIKRGFAFRRWLNGTYP